MKEIIVVWAKLFLILIISAKPLGLKADFNGCKRLGNNLCQSHSECCSGYCFMEPGWEYGVCKRSECPENPKKSIPENNKNKSNDNSFVESHEESYEQDSTVHNEEDDVFEKGVCAYYKGHKITANGDIYDENEMTAAHGTLPFNTMVKVETMGTYVVVKINDRKPRMDGQVLLLSRAASKIMNMDENTGPVQCQLKILTGLGCTPDLGDFCVLNHECCSNNCFREMFSDKGVCTPK